VPMRPVTPFMMIPMVSRATRDPFLSLRGGAYPSEAPRPIEAWNRAKVSAKACSSRCGVSPAPLPGTRDAPQEVVCEASPVGTKELT